MAKIVTLTLNPSLDRTLQAPNWEPGAVNRVQSEREDPGGKGINVSRALKVLGHDSDMMGYLGGYVGRELERLLTADGFTSSFHRCNGTTRANIKIEKDGEVTEFNSPGPTISNVDWERLSQTFMEKSHGVDYIVLAGSLPPGLAADAYRDLINRIRKVHPDTYICLDASGSALAEAIKERPSMIKPNIHELAALFGHSDPELTSELGALSHQAADWLLQLHVQDGIEHCLCSLGSNGLLFVDAGVVHRVSVPTVRPVQTVGCGDSTVAGWIAALVEGKTVAEAACYAASVGTLAATQSAVGLATSDGLEIILAQTKIHTI